MPQGPGLSIAVLGAPVIEIDGSPIDVDTRKAIALLAYLAVGGRPARRDTLAGLLWPEADPERARSALRRTLSTVRTALGGRWLETDRDAVELTGDGLWLDVADLRRLVAECGTHGHPSTAACDRCLEPLRAAAALDRGRFLAGFGLRDSVEFDDWQQLVGDDLRRAVNDVLDRLADALAQRGDHVEAVAVARRRLAHDPLHEPAHRRLIAIYAASGDRPAALEQYRDCVRVLDRELGVRPLDETTSLYHAVVDGTFARLAEPTPTARTVTPDEPPPLVGREQEWSTLTDAYEQVGPDGRLTLLAGEAGIGKTRLGEEFLEFVERGGGSAVGVRCFQDEATLEYGVVSQLARAALSQSDVPEDAWWRSEVARLLPELGPAPDAALDNVAAQARFYEAVCALVDTTVIGSRKATVFVDDVHWADEASLGLLAYLTRRLRGRRVLVLLTLRPEDASPEQGAWRLLAEAKRDRRADVVALSRLSEEAVEELVRSRGRNGELGARLHRETGGLPFFLVEYLDAIERDPDAASWPLPGGIRDLLAARVSTLDDLAAQVLAAAAVLGRSFDTDTIRDAGGRTEDETVHALEQLVARGLLVESSDGSLDFRHEQARDLVYAEMTLARRRLLHRRAAAALDGRGRGERQPALIARHLELAGDDRAAAELFGTAGQRARALYANVEALDHYRTALALGHPDLVAVQQEIGDLETLAGDYGAALASYETAAASATPEELPWIDYRLGLLHLRRGEWELADVRLGEAAERLPEETKARALAARSLAAYRAGRRADAETLAAEAHATADACGDTVARAEARNALGILAGSRHDHGEAVEHLDASLELARAAGDRSAEIAAGNNLALALGAAGDLERALELTVSGLELCATIGDRHREAALRNNLADLLHRSGRSEESMAELKRAVTLFAEVGEQGRLEPEIWKLTEW